MLLKLPTYNVKIFHRTNRIQVLYKQKCSHRRASSRKTQSETAPSKIKEQKWIFNCLWSSQSLCFCSVENIRHRYKEQMEQGQGRGGVTRQWANSRQKFIVVLVVLKHRRVAVWCSVLAKLSWSDFNRFWMQITNVLLAQGSSGWISSNQLLNTTQFKLLEACTSP